MPSKSNVRYDLSASEFVIEDNGNFFYFSSMFHLDKFMKKRQENRDIINYSLSKRFSMQINANLLADIVLYRKIESRGFLIRNEMGVFTCPDMLTLNGASRITPRSKKL